MKIKEQKTQSFSNEKRPYEKPILHVFDQTSHTASKRTQDPFESATLSYSYGPS